ncbi:MAG: acyltransferase family protein [Rhodocyclales bacterium]|nr:acyltransferase family protein [Rhodocyclales bacterium]
MHLPDVAQSLFWRLRYVCTGHAGFKAVTEPLYSPALRYRPSALFLSVSSVSFRALIEIRAAWRMFRVFLHLCRGILVMRFTVPRISGVRLERFKRRWSVQLLDILGVELRVAGDELPQRALMVCNHISWLDVFVINAVAQPHFVCKDEIRKWPLVGWLIAATETIFIARSNRTAAARTAKALTTRLQQDERVAFFPEGTTTNGTLLLPFSAALFDAAPPAQAQVVPMVLRYSEKQGRQSLAPAYDGDVTFMESLRAIAKAPALVADLRILPAIPAGFTRREYATMTRETIARELGFS